MTIIEELRKKYGTCEKTNKDFSLLTGTTNYFITVNNRYNVILSFLLKDNVEITAVDARKNSIARSWNVYCNIATKDIINLIEFYVKNCQKDIGYIKKPLSIVTMDKAVKEWIANLEKEGISCERNGYSILCHFKNSKLTIEPSSGKITNSLFFVTKGKYSELFTDAKSVKRFFDKISNIKGQIKAEIEKITENEDITITKTSVPLVYEAKGYGTRALIRFDKKDLYFKYAEPRKNQLSSCYFYGVLDSGDLAKLLRRTKRKHILYEDNANAYFKDEKQLDLSSKKDLEEIQNKLPKKIYSEIIPHEDKIILRVTKYGRFVGDTEYYSVVPTNKSLSIYKSNVRWSLGGNIKKGLDKEFVVSFFEKLFSDKVESSVQSPRIFLCKGQVVTANSVGEFFEIVSAKMSLKQKIKNARIYNDSNLALAEKIKKHFKLWYENKEYFLPNDDHTYGAINYLKRKLNKYVAEIIKELSKKKTNSIERYVTNFFETEYDYAIDRY